MAKKQWHELSALTRIAIVKLVVLDVDLPLCDGIDLARRLGVPPARAVFVGDDPVTDIAGARQVGMPTIRVVRPGEQVWEAAIGADAVIESMDEVPETAAGLIDGRRAHVV